MLRFHGIQSFTAEALRDNYNRYKGIVFSKSHRLLTWVHRATKSRRGRQHLRPIVYQSPLKVRSRCCLSLHLVRLLAQGASAWKLVRHHRSLTSPVASLSRTEGTKIRLAQSGAWKTSGHRPNRHCGFWEHWLLDCQHPTDRSSHDEITPRQRQLSHGNGLSHGQEGFLQGRFAEPELR